MLLNPVISKLSGKLVVLASASPRRLEILSNAVSVLVIFTRFLHGQWTLNDQCFLFSSSALMRQGLRFEVVPSWFKETLDKSLFKSPYDYAVETAKQKALEVAHRMPFVSCLYLYVRKQILVSDHLLFCITVYVLASETLEKSRCCDWSRHSCGK